MAAAEVIRTGEVLLPQETLDAFAEQASAFLRRAQPGIAYKETVGAQPEDVFCLNDTLFAKLQVYILAAFAFPQTEEEFKNKYPLSGFSLTKLGENDYNVMNTTLTKIHQHCSTFQTSGINPMIELSHSIANFADEVVTLVNALKEQLETVCDPAVPLGGPKSRQARSDAKEILLMLKTSSEDVHSKCKVIYDATSLFKTQTMEDERSLDDLTEKMEAVMPESLLDEAVMEQMKATREALLALVRQQEKAASKAENAKKKAWVGYIPWVGPILYYFHTEEVKNALKELGEKTNEYNRKMVEGNRQKLELVESSDRIRGLSHSISDVAANIKDAQLCLQNMMDGMASMKTNSDIMIKKLETLEGRVMPESVASGLMVKMGVDAAVKAWNTVLQVAREFAKHGLIVKPDDKPVPREDKAPQLLAAHFGGQDVTTIAKLIFVESSRLMVNTKDLPLPDPWQNVTKSLSLLYSFGNPMTAEKRVFVGKSDENSIYILTGGDLTKEPSGTSVAAEAEAQLSSSAGLKIYAVIYGLRQITDSDVYQKLYSYAARNERVPISNAFFNAEGHKDPWYGVKKSAAIVYTFNGVWKSISGREYESVSWNF